MRSNQSILLATLLFFFPFVMHSQVTSEKDGDWHSTETWKDGIIPSANDDVIIRGHDISISTGNVTIKNLTLDNLFADGTAQIKVSQESTLDITEDFIVHAYNEMGNVGIAAESTGKIVVAGNMDVTRNIENMTGSSLTIELIGSSQLIVAGDFNFSYGNSGTNEGSPEISLNDQAVMEVMGNTNLSILGGNKFNISLEKDAKLAFSSNGITQIKAMGGKDFLIGLNNNSQIDFNGPTVMTNENATSFLRLLQFGETSKLFFHQDVVFGSKNGKMAAIELTGLNAELNFKGDLAMTSDTDESLVIDVKENSKIYFGGDIERPTKFGTIKMGENASFIYNGSQPQVIACNKLPDSGNDQFFFANVIFANTSGEPMAMEGDIEVISGLALDKGIIATTDSKTIIVLDNASITGGSEDSYVDGPIIKKGKHSEDFTFPVGNEGKYAPLTITASASTGSEYKARFMSCPPPFGNSISANIESVATDQYWELERTQGSDDVNVTLNWNDASSLGNVDADSVVVAMYSETEEEWISIGRSALTGGIGVGESGSVSNLISCPPPFGNSKFTVAAVKSELVSSTTFVEENNFAVFPNPVGSTLNLQSENLYSDGHIKLYHQNGSLLYMGAFNFNMGTLQLDTQELKMDQAGVYFMQLDYDEGSEVLKLIKK